MKNKIKKILSLSISVLAIASGSYACGHDDISESEALGQYNNETALAVHPEENHAEENQSLYNFFGELPENYDLYFQEEANANQSEQHPINTVQLEENRPYMFFGELMENLNLRPQEQENEANTDQSEQHPINTVQPEENHAEEDQSQYNFFGELRREGFNPYFQEEEDEAETDPFEQTDQPIIELIPYCPGNDDRVSLMASYLPYYICSVTYDDVLPFYDPSVILNSTARIILKSQGVLPALTENEIVSPKALASYLFKNWQTIFEFLDSVTGDDISNINFNVSAMNDDEPILPNEEDEEYWSASRWINNTDDILCPSLMHYLPKYITAAIYVKFFDVSWERTQALISAEYSFYEISQRLYDILDECIHISRLDPDELFDLFRQNNVVNIAHGIETYIIHDDIIPLPDLSRLEPHTIYEIARYFVRNWATLYLMLCIKRDQILGSIPLNFDFENN